MQVLISCIIFRAYVSKGLIKRSLVRSNGVIQDTVIDVEGEVLTQDTLLEFKLER